MKLACYYNLSNISANLFLGMLDNAFLPFPSQFKNFVNYYKEHDE